MSFSSKHSQWKKCSTVGKLPGKIDFIFMYVFSKYFNHASKKKKKDLLLYMLIYNKDIIWFSLK